MRNLTKLFSASAFALSVSLALAAPSQAAVFADYTPTSNANNINWVSSGTNGVLFTTATATANVQGATAGGFRLFDDVNLPTFGGLQATLNLYASVTNTPALYDGATYKQTGLNGYFDVVYTGATVNYLGGSIVGSGGTQVVNNSVLLHGVFTNAWIEGSGASGSFDIDLTNGGNAVFTSIYDPGLATALDQSFTIHLGAAPGAITALDPSTGLHPVGPPDHVGTTALRSFRANAGGSFSDTVAVVPEPGSWALMILGFGGAGVMLRRRRQVVALA